MSKRFLAGSIALLFSCIIPQLSHATSTRFSAYDLWPSVGDRNYFSMSSSEGLKQREFFIELDNTYAHRPIKGTTTTGAAVPDVVAKYLAHTLSLGFGFFDNWQIGVSIPIFSYARVSDPTVAPAAPLSTRRRVGDLRFTTKIRLVNADVHTFGLALEPFIIIPFNGDEVYLGESRILGGMRVIGDVKFNEYVRLALNVGSEFRERVIINNVNMNHRFLSNLGLSLRPVNNVTLSAEVQANTAYRAFFSEKEESPVEFLGGVRWDIGESGFSLAAGGGSCGVCGVKAPKFRGFLRLAFRHQFQKRRERAREHYGDIVGTNVYFNSNRSRLDQDSRETLDDLSTKINKKPHVGPLEVRGHTDSRGRADYNQRLSEKRARKVADYLNQRGIPANVTLTPTGVGEDEPAASNDTREGRARNRRVNFHRMNP